MMRRMLLLASLLALAGPSGEGCDLLPHEWVLAAKQATPGVCGPYALADALYQCRRKIESEFGAAGRPAGNLLFAGCSAGNPGHPLAGPFLTNFEEAISTVWPASQAGVRWQTGLGADDHESMVRAARSLPASYSVFLRLTEPGAESIQLVDGVFYLWACLRLVLKETATLFVKVIDRHGQTVFLDEFRVSPTVIAELILTPAGCYLARLEKWNSRPVSMFFESVKPGVHGLFLQNEFPPDSGIPPLDGRELPLPGAMMSPQPPVIFLENASGAPGK